MRDLLEMSAVECEERLRAGKVGRMAVSTPTGPHIVPLNYVVVDDAHGPMVVVRTAAYSLLGTYGTGSMLAFQIDEIEAESEQGWSVEVRGRGEIAYTLRDTGLLRAGHTPEPWAAGHRSMFLKLRWTEISGRRLRESDTL
ncbi:MAG TPA: pyridoxamine 5'-phosphate oxidase family protein [Nocardioides sp.]|uniref:pyridoxamine 5'-phosphate oxidase family protein n=1 Tax=Nocardioides sp. TaxID=35761 RepID=UPI002EDB4C76